MRAGARSSCANPSLNRILYAHLVWPWPRAMALGIRILTAAAVLAVFSAGQALADDSLSTTPPDTGGFVVGGSTAQALDEPPKDENSLWMDLRTLFSDATVSIGATPLDKVQPLDADPGYNAYAQIDIGGFTVGGRFARWGDPSFGATTRQSFGFGASYRLRSWTLGVDFSRGDYNEAFLNVDSDDTSDVIAFTSSYALRPGVNI